MDKVKQKYAQLLRALKTLNVAVERFKKLEEKRRPELGYDEDYRLMRDALTQRFEYTTDLLWKYFKLYLESREMVPELKSPKGTIRQACEVKLISEQEAEQLLAMVNDRNLTSHIYVEEVAEQIAGAIPRYYQVMNGIAIRLDPEEK